jgi:hypothetical protein
MHITGFAAALACVGNYIYMGNYYLLRKLLFPGQGGRGCPLHMGNYALQRKLLLPYLVSFYYLLRQLLLPGRGRRGCLGGA